MRRRRERMLQQFIRERDLIIVGDKAALEAELAIIALHFRRHTGRGVAHPFAQRRKLIVQSCDEFEFEMK